MVGHGLGAAGTEQPDVSGTALAGEMLSTLAQLDADQCVANALRDAAFAQVALPHVS